MFAFYCFGKYRFSTQMACNLYQNQLKLYFLYYVTQVLLFIILIFGIVQGWEETVVKQEKSEENQSELKISLPSMPSLYIITFLCQACEEIHRIGGHVLDKSILQKFASKLLEKVCGLH